MLNAEERRAALEKIAAHNNGKPLPEAVVEAARDPEHCFHNDFDWNVETAAYQHWLDQARAIIRAVRVHITTTHRIINSIAYVRDPSAGAQEQGYVSIITVKKNPADALAVVTAELARVEAAIDRAMEISEAVGLEKLFLDRLIEMVSIRPSRKKAA